MAEVSSALNAARRGRELAQIAEGGPLDVLVIGGGITGVGVALDAASRGLSVALVERGDLAFGTSRWSSKLVHGGLRYLAQKDFGLAWESAQERRLLMDVIAPHLIRPFGVLLPLGSAVSKRQGNMAETGVHIANAMRVLTGAPRSELPIPRRISAEETVRLAPALPASRLRSGLLYWDGQLEDDARLVVNVARTAASFGAKIITYCEVEKIADGKVHAKDTRTNQTLDIATRLVVNCTGVWAPKLHPAVGVTPSKGSHLLIPAGVLGYPRAAVTVPVVGETNRWVFAIPMHDDLVLVGITDDPYTGEIPDEPKVEAKEKQFLMSAISRAFEKPLTDADVVGSFAGFRPLVPGEQEGTSKLSRKHLIVEDTDKRLISIVGGKLTTYRRMAEDVMEIVVANSDIQAMPCRTATLPLVGAAPHHTLEKLDANPRLIRRYGTEAVRAQALAERHPELMETIGEDAHTLAVELAFGLQFEGALTVDDLLDRRTRLGLVPQWRASALEQAKAMLSEVVAA